MHYCSLCVLPDTRPGLIIGADGVCSACKAHADKKHKIDWKKRKLELEQIILRAKKKSSTYDCVIPVSGGKDSTWQVVKALEFGLRVLAVTWRTPARSKLGQENLNNLISLGVDHIDYSIDPNVERKFMYKTLEKTGSTAVPMHMALFSIPLKIAVNLRIPLVIWGESPHMEYEGSREIACNRLNLDWFNHHGILQNTDANDWLGKDLTKKELTAYFLPSKAQFEAAQIESIFLGYYLPWDPLKSLEIARKNGFQIRKQGPKVGYYNYADIDCDFISVHHYFKWLKFGFTRLFDNLSLEIRNKRMTRDKAISIIRKTGLQYPHDDIKRLVSFLGISLSKFHKIEEKFRNKAIWQKESGRWKISDFLVPDWRW